MLPIYRNVSQQQQDETAAKVRERNVSKAPIEKSRVHEKKTAADACRCCHAENDDGSVDANHRTHRTGGLIHLAVSTASDILLVTAAAAYSAGGALYASRERAAHCACGESISFILDT